MKRWTPFAVLLVMALSLGLAPAAGALTLPPLPAAGSLSTPLAAEPDDEALESEADEEWEVEGCEVVGEDEGEEEEICEEEEPAETVPPACRLSSSEATVSASAASDRVRLAIRYTTSSPAAVEVEYFLRGRKGPLSFADQRKRFGKTGVFRATAELGEVQMEKVLAAKSFTVQMHAAGAPRSCDQYFDRHLTVRRSAGKALTWSDPLASARSGA